MTGSEPIKPKSFDNSRKELQSSELTSVSLYELFVSMACRWYPWMAVKVIEGNEGSRRPTWVVELGWAKVLEGWPRLAWADPQ